MLKKIVVCMMLLVICVCSGFGGSIANASQNINLDGNVYLNYGPNEEGLVIRMKMDEDKIICGYIVQDYSSTYPEGKRVMYNFIGKRTMSFFTRHDKLGTYVFSESDCNKKKEENYKGLHCNFRGEDFTYFAYIIKFFDDDSIKIYRTEDEKLLWDLHKIN